MKTKLQRAAKGRAKFYSRDSGGKHEQTPAQYVEWAQRQAKELGLQFNGTPAEISHMIDSGQPVSGDLFFDYCVSGNKMSRPALDALREAVRQDQTISHILVPRRNRLARPDSAIEGLMLENELRESGITLVYMDRMLEPLKRGRKQDLGESIVALSDFEQSGKERTELAVKFIYAQLSLAQMGLSTGGRPPFAFRRVLIGPDGEVVRDLEEGEIIRRQGYHVVWLPGPESKIELVREILDMLERMPATQVARYLNAKGIPSPDAGRRRKDLGAMHHVSGQWHANTIKNIATNPLLRAVTSYGRRSMGDQRRMTPTGPRFLEDQDFRPDGLPKVIRNDESQIVTGKARFEPLIDAETAERLASILNTRAGTQRAKPRSQKPEENPLGARVFDANCTWPMYRESYQGSFRYVCAKYQQFRPHQCNHNCDDGVAATKLALAIIRQKVLLPGWRARLESKLRQRAANATLESRTDREIAAKQTELTDLRSQMALAERNAALAKSSEMFQAIQQIHDELRSREQQLQRDIAKLKSESHSLADPSTIIDAALVLAERLPNLASDSQNLGPIGELFRIVNLQLFLRFHPVQKKKRIENKLLSGILTLGDAPSPIEKYAGPTGRRALQQLADCQCKNPEGRSPSGSVFQTDSGEKAKSLGNQNRAGGI